MDRTGVMKMSFRKQGSRAQTSNLVVDTFFAKSAHVVNQVVYSLPQTDSLIWYENRDGYHANSSDIFDNIIERSAGVTSVGVNRNEVYRNGIVLSNSSTALGTTERTGSNSRTLDNGWFWWYSLRDMWERGTIQFFPEHQDYDEFDWFKINQPYVVTTFGSSGSEFDEIRRCRDIVNAISLDVRKWMIENKRVGDVLSYLIRANTRFDYLDPINHRVVIDGRSATPADIALAKSLTTDSMPPRLSLHVVSDSHDMRNTAGLPLTSTIRTPELAGFQRVDGTPTRTIEVEIRSDKPCEIHWIKSQGECVITYQSTDKRRATITIPHQFDLKVKTQVGEIVSNRVELIAIGYDGKHYSSPVFVTEYFAPESRKSVTPPTPAPAPQPEPQPQPSNVEQRIAAVEAIITKLKDALK